MFSYNSPPNYIPIINEPFLYIVGFGLSNDATTPNNIMDIAAGQCRDSTDAFDINLGTAITINITNKGFGGLDTGTVAANKIYAIVVISDPINGNPTGAMFTLTPSAPSLPFGYSVWRSIGYASTDSSSHILKGQWTAGGTGRRKFVYDIPQAALTSGSATSLTGVDLINLVPPSIAELPVNMYYIYTPAAAGHTAIIQGYNRTSSGAATTITGQVTSVQITGNFEVIAEINASNSHPEVKYVVGNGSDTLSLSVSGYSLNI